MRRFRRKLLFVSVAGLTAFTLLASAEAQQKKPATKPPAAPAAKPGAKPPAAMKPDDDVKDGGTLATKEDRAPAGATKDAGTGGSVVESKTLDGGGKVFRFGEVEVEGRLKSPQIVYFLRRVRAEFAAGDLGHRTFMRELSETKNEPGF